MTGPAVTRTDVEGFEGIRVHTGLIELTLVPELGGKISSLRDLRNGREWLWRHPRFAYKKIPYGSSYVTEADTGGWDECFPSVSACEYPSEPWKGAMIQDHGELWHQTAETRVVEDANTICIDNRWQGIALPYTFSRSVTLASNSSIVRADYEVTNDSGQPIHYVWCIHPLLAIEPGMELLLPSSAMFNIAGSFPDDLAPTQKNLQYPFPATGLDLPSLPETDAGIAIKLWSDPLSSNDAGWATLRAHDGEFKMRWDVNEIPQIAAWLNLGKWAADGGSPYYNLGLEPCIGAQDSLNDAVNIYDLYSALPPHGKKNWWLEIELTA